MSMWFGKRKGSRTELYSVGGLMFAAFMLFMIAATLIAACMS